MSRRATTPTAQSRPASRFARNDETDAPLVPDIGRRSDSTDRTDTPTDTTRDCAERRRRDPFELALMEDSD